MKFTFTSQTDEIAVVNAPSGRGYVINRGAPFDVVDDRDINYFSNKKQFKKFGIFDSFVNAVAPKKEISAEDLFLKQLNEIKVSDASKNKLHEQFRSMKDLYNFYANKQNLAIVLNKKDAELVYKYLDKLKQKGEI